MALADWISFNTGKFNPERGQQVNTKLKILEIIWKCKLVMVFHVVIGITLKFVK